MRRFLAGFALLVFASSARAYPSFIGYGYNSCLNCHFNAFGGGPLTDHGRAVMGSTIAAKPLYDREASDEDLGDRSGLFGRARPPRWIKAQASYRGLFYASQIQARTRTSAESPQADLSLVIAPARWLWVSGTAGAYPVRNGQLYPKRGWYTREHYLALQFADSLRLYAGLMDLVYGVRIPDSETYSRADTGVVPASQSHGVVFHYGSGKWEGGLHVVIGNYLRPQEERVKGFSFTAEREVEERIQLGFSAAKLDAVSGSAARLMGSVHARAGVGEGSSILTELGAVRNSGGTLTKAELTPYFLLQTMSRIARGWNFLLTSEFRTQNITGPAPREFRIAPGLLYFPMQRLEFRADLRATRTIAGPTVEADGLDFIMQVHLWF